MYRLLHIARGPFLPDSVGGSELSMHSLLSSLVRRGWQVEVVCTRPSPEHDGRDVPDVNLGYPCYRVDRDDLLAQIDDRIGRFQPHACLAGIRSSSLNLLERCTVRGIVGFYYATIHEDLLVRYGPSFRLPAGIHALANSAVTAADLQAATSEEVAVVRPMVDFACYRVCGVHRRDFITLVNPIPVKGAKVAIAVAARMPDRRFLFVKARWGSMLGADLPDLGVLPPNVQIWDTQSDMRRVYGATSVLLFPSQWEESAGRVVLEAQVNGIPVVASNVGGIPQQLGPGGILVEPRDDVSAYVLALRSLEDPTRYDDYVRRALANSRREELQSEYQVDQFVAFAVKRIGARCV